MIDNKIVLPEDVFETPDKKLVLNYIREIAVGNKKNGVFIDRKGIRFGHKDFDKAKAWIKIDGTHHLP